MDDVNRRTYARSDVVDILRARSGAIDAGEAAVLERIGAAVRGAPILDLGVGGGRTIPLLRALSEDYTALEYVEELVSAARAAHPGVRIEHGDARDLSRFRDESFALVFFSFNGIDCLPHEDRPRVFREARRVLRPGGVFAYSTHNVPPGRSAIPMWRVAARSVVMHPHRALRHLPQLPAALRARRRGRELSTTGDGWLVAPDPSYGFALVLHHVTLAEAQRETRDAGFSDTEVYASDGERLQPEADESTTLWFHVLAHV